MKLLIYFFSIFIYISAFASESNEIEISRTFKIVIPFHISTKVEVPSLHSKLIRIKGNSDRSESQILIVHNKPQTFANKFSVERYWKNGREQTKLYDKKENDQGCIRKSARSFQCSRDVGQDGKFISESVYWNTKSDLVLIRVTSLNSFSETRKILNKIKTVQNSRIPASFGSAK